MELITGYLSGSDDDDEDRDDDDEDRDDDTAECNLKRKKATSNDDNTGKKPKLMEETCGRLPLPADILSMFVTEPEVKDNPEEHAGRIRSFSHERGNWASFVYAYGAHNQEDYLKDLTDSLIDILHPVAKFHPCDDIHISLSRTFVLRHHWIDPLVRSLRQKLAGCQRTSLTCGSLKWYCNDEKTRTFVAIYIEDKASQLASYTKTIDSALQEFKLPLYYEKPSFHISLAWCLDDKTEDLRGCLTSDIYNKVMETSELIGELDIKELRLKTGNKFFSLPLAPS